MIFSIKRVLNIFPSEAKHFVLILFLSVNRSECFLYYNFCQNFLVFFDSWMGAFGHSFGHDQPLWEPCLEIYAILKINLKRFDERIGLMKMILQIHQQYVFGWEGASFRQESKCRFVKIYTKILSFLEVLIMPHLHSPLLYTVV